MTARRSRRTAGVKLSDDYDELTTSIRKNILAEKRQARESKHADIAARVTFFDLLPELRLRIYTHAMEREEPRDIRFLKRPTLAMVSKQVRSEALPVFFSECEFCMTMWSNGQDVLALDQLAALPNLTPLQVQTRADCRDFYEAAVRFGRLEFQVKTEAWLTKMIKEDALIPAFRHVDLTILSSFGYHLGRMHMGIRPPPTVIMRLKLRCPIATRSRPSITASPLDHLGPAAVYQHVQDRIQGATDVLVASRERFIGFTLADLREISAALKYWPMDET